MAARLATGRPISGYNGFDPTGDSLHIGHLVPIFGLIRLQRFGGRPVAVVGGGTGMIGDPSGRSTERNLLDGPTLEANLAAIRSQLERFLDFTPRTGATMVNNLDWLGKLSLIDFLRDTGKHFTIPYMLAKDSVQVRLERGLSFTEFSYMLLQAYDFAHLHTTMGVELQMGGADQWGNITAGLELIRRTTGAGEADADPVHGLAYKLLLSPSGTKFGKSETGDSVWLDPARTSPYDFYQHWLNGPTTATSARTCAGSPSSVARRSRRSRRTSRERQSSEPPSGRWRSTSRPGPMGRRPRAGRRRFGGTLWRAFDRGPVGPRLALRLDGWVRLRCGDPGSRNGRAARGRRLGRLERGGPADDRRRRGHDQRDAGDGRRVRPGADRRGVARRPDRQATAGHREAH